MKWKFFVLTWVIALLGLLVSLPLSAETIDGYEYTVINGDATITGYQGDGGHLTIPAAFSGMPVVAIAASSFADCDQITTVVIPDTVTSIGAYAFICCTALSSVTVGTGVAAVGEKAFKDCTALTQVLWNAKNVNGILRYDNVFENAGTAGDGIDVIFGDNVETIPNNFFRTGTDQVKLSDLTIGKNVKTIGVYALPHFVGSALVIPDSVETIGECAFTAGTFTSVSFGKNLKEIGNSAFIYCENLTSVVIPDQVESIGDSAFRFCGVLSQLTLGANVTKIGDNAFSDCPALTTLTIPENVSVIDGKAFGFYYCGNDLSPTTLTISGYTYSAAQRYAAENGIPFVSLGGVFNDVAKASWFEASVNDLVAQNILCGYNNGDGTYSFQPSKEITRAEFSVILARSAGVDLTAYDDTTSFSDVSVSHWAAGSIAWAYQHQIVYGVGNGKYAPNARIIRQDMAVMIARFAKDQGIALPQSSGDIAFADLSDIASYAVEAVAAMQKAGIINGVVSNGKTYFKATSCATRAEAAKMISYLLSLSF